MKLVTTTLHIQKQLVLCDLIPNFNKNIFIEYSLPFTEQNGVISFENKKVVLDSLKNYFPAINVSEVNIPKTTYEHLKIDVYEHRIFIKLPKNQTDIDFIRRFQFVRWDKQWLHWIVPN
jgi:hypothetical protein